MRGGKSGATGPPVPRNSTSECGPKWQAPKVVDSSFESFHKQVHHHSCCSCHARSGIFHLMYIQLRSTILRLSRPYNAAALSQTRKKPPRHKTNTGVKTGTLYSLNRETTSAEESIRPVSRDPVWTEAQTLRHLRFTGCVKAKRVPLEPSPIPEDKPHLSMIFPRPAFLETKR